MGAGFLRVQRGVRAAGAGAAEEKVDAPIRRLLVLLGRAVVGGGRVVVEPPAADEMGEGGLEAGKDEFLCCVGKGWVGGWVGG